ncbi:MAG: DEAD/DEAH box helicase [Candidatus Thorarchaeota archaeon]
METIIPECNNDLIKNFINNIAQKSEELNLQESILYYNYPFFLDENGELLESQILVISKYGIFIIWVIEEVEIEYDYLMEINEALEQLLFTIQSKLMISSTLRKFHNDLNYYISKPLIYTPLLRNPISSDYLIFQNEEIFFDKLHEILENKEILSDLEFVEIRALLEGSKPLKKKKKRKITSKKTKGKVLSELEKRIALFDKNQMTFFPKKITGPTRIRGLAGSGKTIILTMKAAMIHLSNPEAVVVYTFWTKSLYQQIKNWIGKFYRQYSNGRNPNWDKIKVLHGWGSMEKNGFYREICISNGRIPLNYSDVKQYSNPFDEACKRLINDFELIPRYDYILIDEGQDFPASFIKMCDKLAKENKFILAYDDQQLIFQSKAPNPGEIFGYDREGKPKRDFIDDIILYKVYRNPRELLICAHALGFGIYGNIVQVIEDMDYWEDIGYIIRDGEPISGSLIKVERPKKNSLTLISSNYKPEEIVRVEVCKNLEQEIEKLVEFIKNDIFIEKLNPDDILVIAVNDFNAKDVLKKISRALEKENIRSNDIHSDPLNIMNFFVKDRVTLSTIHKAKGNEAYSVYMIDIDFLFNKPSLIKRNRIFTGITRSKAWVTLMGVGNHAEECEIEISKALNNFPSLIFKYPDEEEVKRIKRELSQISIQKMKKYKLMEEIISKFGEELSDEELETILQDYIKSRSEND